MAKLLRGLSYDIPYFRLCLMADFCVILVWYRQVKGRKMLILDLLLAAGVGSLYGALGSRGEKSGCAALAWFGYAGMTFCASAAFVFIISANLGG